MSIGISYFSCLAHIVLQILPAHTGRQILHNQTIFGAKRRSIAGTVPGIAFIFVIPSTTTVPIISISFAVAARTTCSTSCRFHNNSFSQQLLPVQLIYGVIRITIVLEFNESIAIFNQNIPCPAIAFEEALQIAFPDAVRQTTNIHA